MSRRTALRRLLPTAALCGALAAAAVAADAGGRAAERPSPSAAAPSAAVAPAAAPSAAAAPAAAPSAAALATGRFAPRAAERPSPRAVVPPAARSATLVESVRYGRQPAQTLDVHRPAGAASAPRPAVLVVHGGGWFAGDKRRMEPLADALAGAGFVVFNADYTLASRARPGLQVQLRDLRAALAWARAHAARLGADPRRIGALGTSAGGHLAALLATTAPRRPAAAGGGLRAVATWSAPFDLTALPPGQLRGLAAVFAGCPRPGCRARLTAGSPLAHVTAQSPPMLIVNARRELVPPRQATRMAAALAAAGVARELALVPGALHGRQLAPQALAPTIAFLRRQL